MPSGVPNNAAQRPRFSPFWLLLWLLLMLVAARYRAHLPQHPQPLTPVVRVGGVA
jgi:hypothetical protein